MPAGTPRIGPGGLFGRIIVLATVIVACLVVRAVAHAPALLVVGSSFPYIEYLPRPGQAQEHLRQAQALAAGDRHRQYGDAAAQCDEAGAGDKVVPLKENSAEFVRRYKEAGAESLVKLIVLEGQGHNFFEGFFHSQALVDFAIARAREGARGFKQ